LTRGLPAPRHPSAQRKPCGVVLGRKGAPMLTSSTRTAGRTSVRRIDARRRWRGARPRLDSGPSWCYFRPAAVKEKRGGARLPDSWAARGTRR
jgi:hypothetical protein